MNFLDLRDLKDLRDLRDLKDLRDCGALLFVFLAFVFGIFQVVDEVMDGNREIDKLTYENVVFFFRYIKAVECSVNLASGFSTGAIGYI